MVRITGLGFNSSSRENVVIRARGKPSVATHIMTIDIAINYLLDEQAVKEHIFEDFAICVTC